MPRKPIADLIAELKSWLPNYDHGKDSYPHLLFRILASVLDGEELEDIGYEPFPGVAWHEFDQLGRLMVAIKDKRDVEDIVGALMHDEEEEGEIEERRGSRIAIDDRVEAGKRGTEEYDTGKVLAISGPQAEVGWDSGTRTWTPISDLRLLRHGRKTREPFPSRAAPGVWGPGKWTPSEARKRKLDARVRTPTTTREVPYDRRRPRRR